jgi:putative PEP-CTERM system histidine kinase
MSLEDLLFGGASLLALVLAGMVLMCRPRRIGAGLLAVGLALLAVSKALTLIEVRSSDIETILALERVRLVLLSVTPAVWLPFSLSFARGNGREFLSRWRWLLRGAFLLPVVPLAGFSLLVTADKSVIDLGVTPLVELRWPALVVHGGLMLSSILTLVNLERTFRAAVGTLRWRSKFALIGLGMLFATRIFTSSQALLYSSSDVAWDGLHAGALLFACVLLGASMLRGMAQVEVYPPFAILQGSLTVILAGIYLVAVGALAKVVVFLGGDASFPAKAFLVLLAVVVLGLVSASDRVRLLVRRFMSRHFERPFYDYRALWRTFTERTSSVTEERVYARELVNLVSDAVQALSVSAWLATGEESRGKLILAASTSQVSGPSQEKPQPVLDMRGLETEASLHAAPVELAAAKEAWVQQLKQRHGTQLDAIGARVCVPLVANGEMLGLLLVGYRVSGIPFSVEDFELFKCLAAQAANGLVNLRLSHQLARSRELEAFQSMAAFFVHDLKNTASSFSLMLQNLPAQMENPAFRQDALRAVTKATGRLNDLISRLGRLREGARMAPVSSDLNKLVQQTLDAITVAPELVVTRSLGALPPVMCDPEQIQKVVTNLLINAREAVGKDGRIEVSTAAQNGWVVFSVTDNGCGMSSEFLARSLFRPFQTTKKNGIGIGMFHCKTIVEAHKGRMEVDSEVGKGTIFRVLLPLYGGVD